MKRENQDYDFVVIGGGMAGVCAAIAAARQGCRTALVQDRPVLGGNSSSEIRMHVCGADYFCNAGARRETGILEELRLENLARNPQRSSAMWDLLLHEWASREPRLSLFLNSVALEPLMRDPAHIQAVRVRQLAAERELVLSAPLFADCSGDGQIGAQAGAEFRMGREAAAEFNETLAESAADRHTLGSSLMFMARDMGRPMPFVKPDWVPSFPSDAALQHREHGRYQFGYWWIEWGGQLDTIHDNERIRDELLKITLGIWDHIKNHGDHGAQNWALEWVGMLPGKRESRRFVGDYILRQSDLESGRIFNDEVAYGGWPIDVHPIEGFNSPEYPCRQIQVPLYSIPLRALFSRNIANLFFAGRNVSASHIAFASTRIMATCALMGQAVGTAAAVCHARKLAPSQAAQSAIELIQQRLLADDCFLLGKKNADASDLARQAGVSAGSFKPGYEPGKVTDGVARPYRDDEHCWESAPLAESGAWLALTWPQAVTIRQLQLTFDSELEKRLIFSQIDSIYTDPSILTAMPGRLLKHFELQMRAASGWETVRVVADNRQRVRRELFDPPLTTDAIRLRCKAAYNYPAARLFEIRAYA